MFGFMWRNSDQQDDGCRGDESFSACLSYKCEPKQNDEQDDLGRDMQETIKELDEAINSIKQTLNDSNQNENERGNPSSFLKSSRGPA